MYVRRTGEGRERSRGLLFLVYSTNINKNLLLVMLGDPDCVESQIIHVVYQIVRFDFDCNLVLRYCTLWVMRKLIIATNSTGFIRKSSLLSCLEVPHTKFSTKFSMWRHTSRAPIYIVYYIIDWEKITYNKKFSFRWIMTFWYFFSTRMRPCVYTKL